MSLRKAVTDLGLAAYIHMKDYFVVGRRGKEIYFQIDETKEHSEEKFDQLMMDYMNGEFHRFDSCIMSLKKIRETNFDARPLRFVTDLGAAAYLLMHKYKVVGRRGRSVYFEVEFSDDFDRLALEYINSDFQKFDSCLMSLKQIGEYILE